MEEMIEFEAKTTEKDLYAYNIFCTYTSFQGIFSIVVFIFLIVLWVMKFPVLPLSYKILYPAVGIIFLAYLPIELRHKVKNRFKRGEFSRALQFKLSENAINVSVEGVEGSVELLWEQVYKVSAFHNCLLIYTNRRNAYIIPKSDIADKYDQVIACIRKHVKDFKINIK